MFSTRNCLTSSRYKHNEEDKVPSLIVTILEFDSSIELPNMVRNTTLLDTKMQRCAAVTNVRCPHTDGDVGEDVGDVGDGEDFGDAGGVGGADVVGDADGVGDGEDNGEIWVVFLAGAGTAATRDFSVTAGDASFTTGSLAVSTEVAACFFMVST